MLQTSFEDIITTLESGKRYHFHGGVHPEEHKTLSNQSPIARMPLPERLFIPLKQHVGTEGNCRVEPGQKVLKGEPLTESHQPYAVPVHAPTSGTIIAIEQHVIAHPSGLSELCIELEPDGQDQWTELTPLADFTQCNSEQIIEAICDAGISGMGGAGFPTHIKAMTRKNMEFLVINGAECEPYITSDDRLMREHAWQIRQGIDVLYHLVKPKAVLIAIEDNKPEAIEALQIACQGKSEYRVVDVETKYPAGGEKQLIQVLTGREVPRNGLPADVGILMFNVGTCHAIADAIFNGKPLLERVVTVTGGAVETPGNVWTLLGTPVGHVLEHAGYQAKRQRDPQVIMGGPMMGFTLSDMAVPVVKITNCLLAPEKNELANGDDEQACIRCSACADACPATLLPQQLYWHAKAKEYDKAQEYNLFDCIECGACAYVCPSEIPLVHYYRQAKSEIRIQRDEKSKSEKARERFESRKARLEKEKLEREQKHRQAKEARLAAANAATANNADGAKDKVAAALARAKAKKAAQATESSTNDVPATPAAEDKKAQVAAAIARAKAKKAAAQQSASEPQPTQADQDVPAADPEADKKAKVAAAIARAKAKKAAQQSAPAEQAQDSETEADAGKKAKIAAAVAKAKAKKAAASAPASQPEATPASAPKDDDAEAQKKARIAAAVARAKAKKAEREQNNENS